MIYSQRETFFWLKDAALLGKTSVILDALKRIDTEQQYEFWGGAVPDELQQAVREISEAGYANEIVSSVESQASRVRDYCKIRSSHDLGKGRLIHLLREELSVAELDSGANEGGQLSSGGVKMNEKRFGLRIAKVSGTIRDPIVRYAIEEAARQGDSDFFIKLGRALALKKRPAEIDYQCISVVARLLIDLWCGEKGVYGMWLGFFETRDLGIEALGDGCYRCARAPSFYFHPPLCFLSDGALATYCALVLEKQQSDRTTSNLAVRKWVSRLGLLRATAPKIREVKVENGSVWFRA
jgi:hypothetical protein